MAQRVGNEDAESWKPMLQFNVAMNGAEEDDIVTLQFYTGQGKKAKPWGKAVKCKPTRVWQQFNQLEFDGQRRDCEVPDDMATKKGGDFSVKLTDKQVGKDKVYADFATLNFSVNDYVYFWAGKKKTKAYVVDKDGLVGEGWVSELATDDPMDPVKLRFSFYSKFEGERNPEEAVMRCFMGDKAVATWEGGGASQYYEPYIKDGKQERIHWYRLGFAGYGLYAQRPKEHNEHAQTYDKDKAHTLAENPGKYRCTVTADGDKLAELAFEVGKDGKILRPACFNQDGADSPYVGGNLYPLKVNVMTEAKYDKKAFGSSGYYGNTSATCSP